MLLIPCLTVVKIFNQFHQFMRVESYVSDLISLISQYVNDLINSSWGGMGSLTDLIHPFHQFLGGVGMGSVFKLISTISQIPAGRGGAGRTFCFLNLLPLWLVVSFLSEEQSLGTVNVRCTKVRIGLCKIL